VSPNDPLIAALRPITDRVRTDITAAKNAAGVQAWTKSPLTADRLAAHLNGGPARGVCPIKAGESVTMLAVLDFDSHKGESTWTEMSVAVAKVVDALTVIWGAEPLLFRSSGGRGIHLYLLWDSAQDAYSVRQWLRDCLEAAGLRPGTKGVGAGQVEIFPKQDSVPHDGNGSQFILPLAGRSVPLLLDEISGLLEDDPRGREAVLEWAWATSLPVPVVQRPTRFERDDAGAASLTGLWRQALDAIGNGRDGAPELDYDEWFRVICGIHHETAGSEAGLALAEEFSERSAKHNAEFFRSRVWPYITSNRGGGQVITGRSIMSMAAKSAGWRAPIDDSAFSAIEDDEQPEPEDEDHDVDQSQNGEHAEVVANAAPGTITKGEGEGKVAVKVVRRAVPPAEYRTTDQANAVRLVLAYGRRALSAADRWHVDDGKCWVEDDAGVCRYTCMLSKIVSDEARRCEIEESKESEDE
jgi:hypothetical protein